MLAERVQHGGGRVGQQQHVRLVDLLESADRRAVEHQPVGEDLLIEGLRRHGEVLHRPGQVTEPDIDEFHFVIAEEPEYLVGVGEHEYSLSDSELLLLSG